MEGGGWVGAVEDRSGLDAREKKFPEILFVFLSTHHSDQMSEGSQAGMCGAELFPAGRGKKSAGRGGAGQKNA